MKRLHSSAIFLAMILLVSTIGYSAERIAILDFELNDITSLPNTPAELQRTASMAPLLIEQLSKIDTYQIVSVDVRTQRSANAGFGYLFRHHDEAVNLGQNLDADWIIVSQHSKPSFLYSHLMVQLLQVRTGKLAAEYEIELKGNHTKVTERSIRRLGTEIVHTISGGVANQL